MITQIMYGVEIPPQRFRKEFVIGEGILTPEQYLEVSREVYSGKYKMFPVPDALETINLLMEKGHTFRIVTNRSVEGNTLHVAQDWMAEYKLNIPITGVLYGKSKAEACAGLDLFVDDDPAKLHQLVGVVPHLLFFCWSHNLHEKEPESATRVFSWNDVSTYVQKVSERKG